MLYDKLKQDLAAARGSQSPNVTIYSTLLGELQRSLSKPSDPVSDAVVIATIKKTVKSNSEAIQDVQARLTDDNRAAATSYINKMTNENAVLESYIPAQLTEDEIRAVVTANDIKSLKDGMSFLSTNYSGRYDGSMASKLLKTMF